MNQENILKEEDKLIAKFMGLHYNKYNQWTDPNDLIILDGEEYSINWIRELKYHKSWDALMEPCKKFNDLYFDVLEVNTLEQHKFRCESLNNFVTKYEILPAFKQLVENIKWYNQTKPQQI
jgi:hypothetical protein